METCGDVSREDLLDNPEDLSDCERDSCAHVRVVPDVTDVLVSPSSVVTSCVMFLPVALIAAFFLLQKACALWYRWAEEMRYEGSPVKAPRFQEEG